MTPRLFRIGLISVSLAVSPAIAQQRPYLVEQHDGDLLLFELETGNNWVYEAKNWRPVPVPGKMNSGMLPAEMHHGGLPGAIPGHHPGHPNPPVHHGAGSHRMQPQLPFPPNSYLQAVPHGAPAHPQPHMVPGQPALPPHGVQPHNAPESPALPPVASDVTVEVPAPVVNNGLDPQPRPDTNLEPKHPSVPALPLKPAQPEDKPAQVKDKVAQPKVVQEAKPAKPTKPEKSSKPKPVTDKQ